MKNPRVSILMATWNRASLLGAAIQSVLEQSFNDWELIIADDGSTDNTSEVVANWLASLQLRRSGQKKEPTRLASESVAGRPARHESAGDSGRPARLASESVAGRPRLVYLRSGKNEGISKNYNKGLRVARGEYVAMIDDDDPWCDKEKLRKQIEFLDNDPEYVGCGGGVIVVDKNRKSTRLASESVAGRELYRYLKPRTDAEIRKLMLFSNPMANSTTMFRRGAGEKVGWYDESVRYSGDRDFWLKMGIVGKLYNFPEYFSYYTMSGENTSIVKLRPHLRASLMIMRRYKNKYPHYYPALLFNWIQYSYSFLPIFIRRLAHRSLARLKRLVVG